MRSSLLVINNARLTFIPRDLSVLARIADAEARLQALESQTPSSFPHRASSDVVGKASCEVASPPQFHTAAAHQMIHSWPRLRLCLSDLENPLSFLADADAGEPMFSEDELQPGTNDPDPSLLVSCWQMREITQALHNSFDNMPLLPATLLHAYEGFDLSHILRDLDCQLPTQPILPDVLPLSHATVLCLALCCQTFPALTDQNTTVKLYLKSILQRQWTLLNTTHQRLAIGIAVAYCLLHGWARPFHALGVLQSVKHSLERLAIRAGHNGYVWLKWNHKHGMLINHVSKVHPCFLKDILYPRAVCHFVPMR